MCWQLVEEVLDHCPDLPYRQFRVLVVLAFDARYETRQCRPGIGKIALQANCAVRSAQHAVEMLRRRGLIKRVERAAPGRRPVYEILPLAGAEHRQPYVAGEHRQPHLAGEHRQHPNRHRRHEVAGEHRQHEVAPPTYLSTSTIDVPPAPEREPRDAPAPPGATTLTTDLTDAPSGNLGFHSHASAPRHADCPGCGRPFAAETLADDAKWARASAGDLLCLDCQTHHHDQEGETP